MWFESVELIGYLLTALMVTLVPRESLVGTYAAGSGIPENRDPRNILCSGAPRLFQRFLIDMFGPATPILTMIFFSVWDERGTKSASPFREGEAARRLPFHARELVLAFGFVLIPLAGLIGCKN